MILVDTSAWVQFFRRQGERGAKERVAAALSSDAAGFTCPVLLELLAGARLPAEIDLVLETLGLCTRYYFAAEYWERAAHMERTLRQRGFVVPRDDILVATVACECRLPLMCRDAHFGLIHDHGDRSLKLECV